MATIAVTGCASRFAQVLLPLLESDPDVQRIVGIDRVAPAGTYSKLDFVQRDVRDSDLREALGGCDTLVHLAFIVGRPYALPLAEAADINLRGTWNVCRAAAEAGARKLVVSSSIAAYGILPDNPDVLVEESPLRGLYTAFYYSQHKHANEIWLDGFQHEYPALVISRLRPCIVMGPHQYGVGSLLQGDSYITSPSGRNAVLQLVHEDDLASAFHLMVRRDLPGAFNVVGDEPATLASAAAAAGLQVVEVPDDTLREGAMTAWQAGLTPFGPEWLSAEGKQVCSNAKLKATGEWTPRYTTTESVIATVAAMRGGAAS